MPFSAETSAAVTVTTDLTTILSLTLRGRASVLAVEVNNTGATAFNAFQVQVQFHPDGQWFTLKSVFSAADALLLFYSTDPAALAGGADAGLLVKISTAYAVRVRASVGSSTTTATAKLLAGSE